MTGLGTPNVGVMVAYLTKLLSTATRSPNVPDPVIAPVTFPTSEPQVFGTVLAVFTSGLSSPSALAMNGTTLLVSDYSSPYVTTYSSNGVQGSLTLNDSLELDGSVGLAIDFQHGLIYRSLVDYYLIEVYDLSTGALLPESTLEMQVFPRSLAVQPGTGDLYMTTLYAFPPALTIAYYNGTVGTLSNDDFSVPTCVAFDLSGDTLYVGDEGAGPFGQGALTVIDVATGQTEYVIDYYSDDANLDYVTGITVDSLGYIYIVSQNIGYVAVVTADGTLLGYIDGSGAGNSPYNAFFSVDGFVLPFSVAVDPRGYYVYVSDGAAGNVVQLAGPVALPSTGATVGDPQFYGFRGQSYQVHGIDGEVYNIISDANVQINGRFAFLQQARQCVKKQDIRRTDADGTSSAAAAASVERRLAVPIQCWSHPGSYIGQLSVQTALGVRLVLQPGAASVGFERVDVIVDEAEAGDTLQASVGVDDGATYTWGDLTLTRLSSHHVLLRVSVFVVQLSSSDGFVNVDMVEVSDWERLRHELRSHGLLGQTWQDPAKVAKGEVKGIEGRVDDYLQQDAHIFGTDNLYNRFTPHWSEQRASAASQPLEE